MGKLAWMLCWVVGIALLPAGIAAGDILNGNFQDGLNHWTVTKEVDPAHSDYGVVEVASGQLHLKAVNNYLWQESTEEWLRSETKKTWLVVDQLGTAPSGANAFQFDASVDITGAPAGTQLTAEAYVLVTVYYNNLTASESRKFYATGGGTPVVLEMPDLIAGQQADVVITTQSGLDEDYAEYGEDYHISVEAHLDNMAFVPEPATMALLAAGGLALLRRRR